MHRDLECYVHESRKIGSDQTGDGKSEYGQFRNQQTKIDWMGEFNSDDHYIYYGEQESYRKNGVVIIVNKRVQNAVLGCSPKCGTWIQSQKRQNDFQGKPFSITVIQVYALTSNAEEAKVEQLYEDVQDLLELTPKKDVLFITGDWNAKVGSQETSGVTGKFGLGVQNEAGQRLIEFAKRTLWS